MAVAVDAAVADVTSNSVTTRNLTSLTVGAGTNRYLLVCLTLQAGKTGITVRWDTAGTNQSMTLIGSSTSSDSTMTVYLYGLVAPTSGAKTLTASWTGSSDVTLAAMSFTGVNQTGGATSAANFTATHTSANPITVSQVSATGNFAAAGFVANGTLGVITQTQWYLDNAPNNFSSAAAYATGAATVAFSADGPSSPWALASVNIVAAGGTNTPLTLSNTVSVPATRANRAGKPLSNAITAPALRNNVIAKPLTNTVTTPATAQAAHRNAVALTGIVTAIAALARQAGKPLTNTVTVPATAQTAHRNAVALTSIVTAIAALARQAGKPLTSIITAIAALSRQAGKPLTSIITAAATLQAAHINAVTLTGVATTVGTVARQLGRLLTNAVAAAAARINQTGKGAASNVVVTATRSNQTSKSLLNVVVPPADLSLVPSIATAISLTPDVGAISLTGFAPAVVAASSGPVHEIIGGAGGGGYVRPRPRLLPPITGVGESRQEPQQAAGLGIIEFDVSARSSQPRFADGARSSQPQFADGAYRLIVGGGAAPAQAAAFDEGTAWPTVRASAGSRQGGAVSVGEVGLVLYATAKSGDFFSRLPDYDVDVMCFEDDEFMSDLELDDA